MPRSPDFGAKRFPHLLLALAEALRLEGLFPERSAPPLSSSVAFQSPETAVRAGPSQQASPDEALPSPAVLQTEALQSNASKGGSASSEPSNEALRSARAGVSQSMPGQTKEALRFGISKGSASARPLEWAFSKFCFTQEKPCP